MVNESESRYNSLMGRVALLMTRSDIYCQYPIACLAIWIKPAILLKQIHIFQDVSGTDVGYMTWASIASDTEARLLKDPEVLFHVTEWNEGDRLWIMDFLCVNQSARQQMRSAASILSGARFARSLRRREDGSVRSTSTWDLHRLKRVRDV
jgi:cytolysin-activating lysine-acyltransferase